MPSHARLRSFAPKLVKISPDPKRENSTIARATIQLIRQTTPESTGLIPFLSYDHLAWGTILVRRLGNFEFIGVLSRSAEPKSGFTIANGKDEVVILSMPQDNNAPFATQRIYHWRGELHDDEIGRTHKEGMWCYDWYKPVVLVYLQRFHGYHSEEADDQRIYWSLLRSRHRRAEADCLLM